MQTRFHEGHDILVEMGLKEMRFDSRMWGSPDLVASMSSVGSDDDSQF